MLLRQLFEQTGKTAVVAFGRMNPPTIGHLKLIEKMKSIPGDHLLFLSHSQDPKQNPLPFHQKQAFASKFFPGVTVGNDSVKTPMHMMTFLEQQGYTDVIYVAGSDRVPEFDKLLNTYNGKLYNFNSINIVNAGERDPDADGAEGMSASKMRAAVAADDFESFKIGVPDQSVAQQMYDAVKAGMTAAPTKKAPRKKPETLAEQFNHQFSLLCEEVSFSELNQVERIADALWSQLGVDIKFTRHFFDRVNDERNREPITADELINLFKKEYKKYGKVIASLDDEAVMKDIITKINLPFVIKDRGDSKQLVAKTVMRKANFLTPNHIYAVSEKSNNSQKYIDPEFDRELEYAKHHYAGYSDDPQMAFNKYVDRSILNNKKTDKSQDDQLSKIKKQLDLLKSKLDRVSNPELNEGMLPKSAFAGSNKNKLGPAAHLKGKMKRAAKQGDLVGGMEEALGVGHNPRTIDKISQSVNSWRNDEKVVDQFVTQGHTIKFYPDRMEIYRGADLLTTKLGNFEPLQNKHIVAAKTAVGNLIRKRSSVSKESASNAIDRTAKDLVNPPKIMQHRAKRDQERERQYSGSQLSKRDTSSKDVWGDYKEDWQKVNKSDKTDGMSKKAVSAYRKEHPGSKLKTAVTKSPSKIAKGSSDDKRRKSFCARMSGMKKANASAKTKKDPNSPINKALHRWNCESSLSENVELVMSNLIEQILKK